MTVYEHYVYECFVYEYYVYECFAYEFYMCEFSVYEFSVYESSMYGYLVYESKREVEGDGKGIKDQYMKLLGEKRLLRIKLEKLPEKDTGKRASMTYRDALYVNQGQQSLGTMKIRRVLTPPKQSQIKTVVIKPNNLPGGEAHKNEGS
ncbi:hypothetical protein FOZ60_012435 [Perkinsus olseni]|uniref:Uncharacterized protein n=1 Tax=Perkinsus olseni TaxID=32597 RepID=A0A7J6NBG8_PEROL|nr:hypothetical protein FOZ60_012435 [Perkinsus olseni]